MVLCKAGTWGIFGIWWSWGKGDNEKTHMLHSGSYSAPRVRNFRNTHKFNDKVTTFTEEISISDKEKPVYKNR